MNTYGVQPKELGDSASTDVLATAFAGARVVKTFNQLSATMLARDHAQDGGRQVMFVWSRNQVANTTVIESMVPALEVYSINEAFADLTGVPGDLSAFDRHMRSTLFKRTGIGLSQPPLTAPNLDPTDPLSSRQKQSRSSSRAIANGRANAFSDEI